MTEFKNKYVGQLYQEKKNREFLYLKQNNLTIVEYKREFVQLSKYFRELISLEADMCRKFEWALNEDIFVPIITLNLQYFSVLVEKA